MFKIRRKNKIVKIDKNSINAIQTKTGGDVVDLINKLPFQFHLPGHNYTGPGTHLLLNIEKGLKPVNAVDRAALEHDIDYFENKLSRKEADKKFQEELKNIPTLESKIVSGIMSFKEKLGLGVEERFKKFLEENDDKKIVVKPKEEVRMSLESLYKLHMNIKKDLILFKPEQCYDYEEHKKNNSEIYRYFTYPLENLKTQQC